MDEQKYSFIDKYFRVSNEKTVTRSMFWRRLITIFGGGYLLPAVLFTVAQYTFLQSYNAPLTSIIAFPIVLAGLFMSYSGINIFIVNLFHSNDISILITSIIGIIILLIIAFMHFTLAKKRINDYGGRMTELYIAMIIAFFIPGVNFLYFMMLGFWKTKV